MTERGLLLVAALAAALAAPSPARASLWDTFGFGARATAMGGSAAAHSTDYDAVYYNPANLLNRKEAHFGFGLGLVAPHLSIHRASGQDAFEPLTPNANVGFHLGASTSVGGVFKDKLALGFVLFHPIVHFTRIESIDPSIPHFYRFQNLPDKLIIAFAAAAEPVEWLRLGVGLQVLASLDGDVTGAVSLTEGRFTHQSIDVAVNVVGAPTAGLALGPFRGLRFGATWRSALELSYRLPISFLIEEVGVLRVLIDGTSLYTPDQLALGVSWESAGSGEPGLTAELGLTWERWHKAPPEAALFELSVDDSALHPDPESGEPLDLIVADGPALPLGARDTVTPRVGLEWRPTPMWAVRGGYAWRPTPIPRQRYQTNSLDSTAHIVSLGGGFIFRDPTRVSRAPLHIDVAVQATILDRRVVRKAEGGTPDGAYWFDGVVWNALLDIRHDF
ncbi:MAG: TonB-dependent receptor [Deltaproteobacteria bacterium]|nr:TonB-dependent receptor [Deltaproteobacteria bacterium]